MFPVIEISGTVALHGAPPNPAHVPNAGTSTCWAIPRTKGGSWNNAIITAGHVVNGVSLGSTLPLVASAHHTSPSSATLVDVGPSPIDGAVLKIISPIPTGLASLAILDPAAYPIAPGLLVQLVSTHTTATGTVLRVNQNPGYFGPLMAERIVIDAIGKPGDSGGLVADQSKHDGLGIYIGTIPSIPNGARDGVAQGLWQATEWFDADIWS